MKELIKTYIEKVNSKYSDYDWDGLEAQGFSKKGDYCFIYSYPPVRSLSEISEEDLFIHSDHGSLSLYANVYIHIPYCTGICSYCYFAKVANSKKNPVRKEDYPKTLFFELERMLRLSNSNPEILSIHIGGGTPFLLSYVEIKEIMSFLNQLKLSKGIEITIESSPETVCCDPEKLKQIQDLGINRINLGVESLNDHVLRLMNRRHNSATTLKALDLIFASGFTNVNVDVIYGLPGETLDSWIETVLKLEEIGIHSISAYRLRKHPNKRISELQENLFPSYEEGLKMQLAHGIVLQDKKFVRSSSHKYAREKNKLQYQIELKRGIKNNQLISLGCGAYGFINGTFYWNTHSLSCYAEMIKNKRLPVKLGQVLSKDELMRKAMVLAVHTNRGISIEDFQKTYNENPCEYFYSLMEKLQRNNLLRIVDDHIVPTENGNFFADEISVEFYSESIKEKLKNLGMKYGMFWEQIENS